MSELMKKVEALVDAVTSLVNEERCRRLKQDQSFDQPYSFCRSPGNLYGPRGTEIHFNHRDHQG